MNHPAAQRSTLLVRPFCTAATWAVLLPAALSPVDAGVPQAGDSRGTAMDLSLTDGSVLKVTLREQRVAVQTPYGVLTIPARDVVRIEFAARVPEDVAARIAELGSTDYGTRQAAEAALARMGGRALAGLMAAASHKDSEVARRAKLLLESLREASAEEMPELRKHDVVYTADSKFAGRIEAETWRADSDALGTLRLRLADLRELRAAGAEVEPDPASALPDPGNLTSLQQQVGKRFVFKVTGAAIGPLWGTDVYTADSNLATAAVHAGVLRVGQTGLVRVKIVAAQAGFTGSTRNGVTSEGYASYPAAYQILRRGSP